MKAAPHELPMGNSADVDLPDAVLDRVAALLLAAEDDDGGGDRGA